MKNKSYCMHLRQIAIATMVALLTTAVAQAQTDETSNYGAVWTDIGVSKALPKNFSVDFDAGFRTFDWLENASRFDLSAGVGYKLGKNLKFGLSYTFIRRRFLGETTYKYKDDYDFSSFQGAFYTDDAGNKHSFSGCNVDAANWASRHRISFDVTADKRFWKTLRISLRERYQYTHQNSRDIDRVKYRDANYDGAGNVTDYDDETKTVKTKDAWDRHLLRSRLKFAIDRKGWKWEPFVSAELHNNMSDSWHLDKLRFAAGTEYAITKQHRISAAYIFNHENDDDSDENIHAINIGYRFKF